MAPNRGPERPVAEPEAIMDMNTTPLIDVMLVLLIMLIMTVPVQTHAIKMDMPAGHPPADRPVEVVDVGIDFDGTLAWNGAAVADLATLDAYFQGAAAKPDQPEVHVHPNRLVRYETVAQVLGSAQRNHLVKLGVVSTDRLVD